MGDEKASGLETNRLQEERQPSTCDSVKKHCQKGRLLGLTLIFRYK